MKSYCVTLALIICLNAQLVQNEKILSLRQLNSFCVSSFECGSNAICSHSRSNCICKFGFKQNVSSTSDCEALSCLNSRECRDNFGDATKCVHSLNENARNYCDCEDASVDVYFDSNEQKCVFGKSSVSATACFTDSDCGDGMTCQESDEHGIGKCRCKFGYTEKHDNVHQCARIKCSDNSDCANSFENTKCAYGSCACTGDSKLKDDVCVLKSKSRKEDGPEDEGEDEDEETSTQLWYALAILGIVAVILLLCACCSTYCRNVGEPNEKAKNNVEVGCRTKSKVNPQIQSVDDSLPSYDEVVRNDK